MNMASIITHFGLRDNLYSPCSLINSQKDIRSPLTERAFMVTSIIIPINFLLLFLLFALTGGEAPTAVVLEDHGPYAMQFVSAMEHSHSFIIQQTTASEAQNLMRQGRIVSIVTVPANFDSSLRKGILKEHTACCC